MKRNIFLYVLVCALQGCVFGGNENNGQEGQNGSFSNLNTLNIVQSNNTGAGAEDIVLNEANSLAGLDGLLQGGFTGIASATVDLGVTCPQ